MAKTITVSLGLSDQNKVPRKKPTSAFDFALEHTKTDRVIRSKLDKALKSHNLSMMEWLLLNIIIKNGNEGIVMNQIARSMRINLPQLTNLTTKLLTKNLIRQKTERHDHRQHRLVSTAKGRAQIKLIEPELNQAIHVMLKPIAENHLVFYKRVIKAISSKTSNQIGL